MFEQQSFSFGKDKKLKSRKTIERLFKDGQKCFKHPIQVVFLIDETLEENKAAFSVSKRNFKRAVDRNLIKRRMREAYRLNQYNLTIKNVNVACMFIYVAKDILEYHTIEKSLQFLLEKMSLITLEDCSLDSNNETE